MMDLDEFLARCDALAERLGVARATLSTRIFNDGKRLQQIAAGGDVGSKRLKSAVEKLEALEVQAKQAA